MTLKSLALAVLLGCTSGVSAQATGSGAPLPHDAFLVTDYGATGNGVSDDTTAIQAAINAAEISGGVVGFPSGVYRITAPLALVSPKVSLIGRTGEEAPCASVIKAGASMPAMLVTSNVHQISIENLVFDGSADGGSTIACALDLQDFLGSRVGQVTIRNVTGDGIHSRWVQSSARYSWVNWFVNLDISVGGYALRMGSSDSYVVGVNVTGGLGVSEELFAGNLYRNCVFNNCVNGISTKDQSGDACRISVTDCSFINNTQYGLSFSFPTANFTAYNTVEGCVFEGNGQADILLNNASRVALRRNEFRTTAPASGQAIHTTGTLDYVVATDNRFALASQTLPGSKSVMAGNGFSTTAWNNKTGAFPRERLLLLPPGGTIHNVKSAPYNAIGNNSADDTAKLQAALDSANPGDTVYFPKGAYKITQPLQLTRSGVLLLGDGRSNSGGARIVAGANLASMLTTPVNVSGLRMSKLSFSGGSAYTVGNALLLSKLTDSRIEHVQVNSTSGNSFVLGAESARVTLRYCQAQKPVGHGIILEGMDCVVDSAYVSCTGPYGIRISGPGGHQILNTHVDLETISAIILTDPAPNNAPVTIRNCYFDCGDQIPQNAAIEVDYSQPQAAHLSIEACLFRSNGVDLKLNNATHVSLASSASSVRNANQGGTVHLQTSGTVDYLNIIGNVFANTFSVPGANSVIYGNANPALWTSIGSSRTVTYHGNGSTTGTPPTDADSPYTAGATVTVLGNSGGLTKANHAFTGWNTAASGTGTSYAPGDTFPIAEPPVILYAQWIHTGPYPLIYNGNGHTGGSAPSDSNSPFAAGTTVTLLTNTGGLVKTGHVFDGWYAADGPCGSTDYAVGDSLVISGPTTLYAKWIPLVMWDGGGSDTLWTNAANWNTAADGSGANPDSHPALGETATFNISTLNAAVTTTLNANLTLDGFVFRNTGTTTIATDTVTDRTITLGACGITVNPGAGAVSIGVNATSKKIYFNLSAFQSWINNSGTLLSIPGANGAGSLNLNANQLTVGGSGNITHAGYILGTGSLRKTGAGTLTLGSTSSYSGSTTIEGGILVAGALGNINSNSSIGRGSSGGSAADLVFAGGTLRYGGAAATSTNRLFTIGNANDLTATIDSSAVSATNTTSFTGTGALAYGGSGARTLTLKGSNTGTNTFAPVIGDGSGGATSLVKDGTGTWVVSGAINYAGATTILDGTLSVTAPNFADASTVTIGTSAGSPAVLNLPTAGTDNVAVLIIDGVAKAAGLYDSSNSGGAITGDGKINVGAVSDYDTWKTSNSVTGGPTADDDGDGVKNFDEYAFGLNPKSGASANPISSPLDKTTGLFKYTRRKQSLTGLAYTYESSTTLAGAWPSFTPDATTSNSGDPIEEITVDVPNALLTNPALFLRVKAVQP